jgi:hypothetical protein
LSTGCGAKKSGNDVFDVRKEERGRSEMDAVSVSALLSFLLPLSSFLRAGLPLVASLDSSGLTVGAPDKRLRREKGGRRKEESQTPGGTAPAALSFLLPLSSFLRASRSLVAFAGTPRTPFHFLFSQELHDGNRAAVIAKGAK